jgi:hypothetical protein
MRTEYRVLHHFEEQLYSMTKQDTLSKVTCMTYSALAAMFWS